MTTKCKGCEAPATIGDYCQACWDGHGEADTLAELEGLCKEATSGPWDVDQDCYSRPSDKWAVLCPKPGGPTDVLFEADRGTEADARLVVAARNNLPWMIARIRELESQHTKRITPSFGQTSPSAG